MAMLLALLALTALAEPVEIKDGRGYTMTVDLPADTSAKAAPIAVATMVMGPPTDGFQPNINVQLQASTDGGGLAVFVTTTKGQFTAGGLTLVADKQKKLNGKPAWYFEYSGNMQGRSLHWTALAVEQNPNQILLVTATSTEATWATNKKWLTDGINSVSVD